MPIPFQLSLALFLYSVLENLPAVKKTIVMDRGIYTKCACTMYAHIKDSRDRRNMNIHCNMRITIYTCTLTGSYITLTISEQLGQVATSSPSSNCDYNIKGLGRKHVTKQSTVCAAQLR